MCPIFHSKIDAAATLSLSVSTFEKLVRTGAAPPPRRISDGRVGWLRHELAEWANRRPVSDLPPRLTPQGASHETDDSSLSASAVSHWRRSAS